MPAKDNEKLIFNDIVNKYNPNIEKAKSNHIVDNLAVSVDFIWKERDLTLLLEIDSYSASKFIFGEYVLLNQVDSYKSKCILVIIHFYKKYNTLRTEKYINFAIDKLKCKLPYVAFSNSEWNDLVQNNSKTKLIDIIKKRSKPTN